MTEYQRCVARPTAVSVLTFGAGVMAHDGRGGGSDGSNGGDGSDGSDSSDGSDGGGGGANVSREPSNKKTNS